MQYLKLAVFIITSISATSSFAESYYVDCNNGNNGNAGTSHASAWKSISTVNSTAFDTGDDVYFLAGCKWSGTSLSIDWSGTSTDRVIIGSYYINNGSVVIGVPGGTAKPTIEGGYTGTASIGNVPSTTAAGLVQFKGDYVTLQNFRVINSSGVGITVGSGRHHNILEQNDVEKSSGSSTLFYANSHNNISRNNTMKYCGRGWKSGLSGSKIPPSCNGFFNSWNNIAESNFVSESWGEAMASYGPSARNNTFRGNLIVAGRNVGIYIDNSSDNLIENNMIIGDAGDEYDRGTGGYTGPAFSNTVEDRDVTGDATNNIFRNNLAANVFSCFNTGAWDGAASAGRKVGGMFIGNTCIGARESIHLWNDQSVYQSLEIANNLTYDIENGANECISPTTSNINFHHNSWGARPSDPDCVGNGDVYTNPYLTKTSGWRNTGSLNIPEPKDFVPTNTLVMTSGAAHSSLKNDYLGNLRTAPYTVGAIMDSEISSRIPRPEGLKLDISISPGS